MGAQTTCRMAEMIISIWPPTDVAGVWHSAPGRQRACQLIPDRRERIQQHAISRDHHVVVAGCGMLGEYAFDERAHAAFRKITLDSIAELFGSRIARCIVMRRYSICNTKLLVTHRLPSAATLRKSFRFFRVSMDDKSLC